MESMKLLKTLMSIKRLCVKYEIRVLKEYKKNYKKLTLKEKDLVDEKFIAYLTMKLLKENTKIIN